MENGVIMCDLTSYYFGLKHFNKKVVWYKRIFYRWKGRRKAKKHFEDIGKNIMKGRK